MGREMAISEFEKLVEIMKRLRKECPWDRAQTPQSLRQYILEEAYETVDAIDNEDWQELSKELGDLLLQIIFQAEIGEENETFSLKDVIRNINEKMIRRHPHVFGDVEVKDAAEVKENWENIKFDQENRRSLMEGIPRQMSALLRAQRIQDKASQVGFDWNDSSQVLNKVYEELKELEVSLNNGGTDQIEEEMGDLLFSLVNFCRFQKIQAEDALRRTTNKFLSRFRFIETELEQKNISLREASLKEMDALWNKAKEREK